MTISELIEKLEKIRHDKGDLEIRRLNESDECFEVHVDVSEVYYENNLFGESDETRKFADGFVVID